MSTFDETLGALSALQTGAGLDALRELLRVIREPRDPTRPASVGEERLAMGWRQQIRGRDDIRPRDDDPTGDIDFKPAGGGPGQWVLVSAACVPQSYMHQTGVASVWVRWLVPVSP